MWDLETLKILNDKRVRELEDQRRKKDELAKYLEKKDKRG